MKRILIIEDEQLNASRLRRLLLDLDDTMEVEGPLTSVEEVEQLASTASYDLVFSDIRLKGRLVFEAFKKLTLIAPVIFTTAYDEYALEAFKHNGIDYLLKPIDPQELSEAFEKACRLRKAPEDHSALIQSLGKELKHYRERILVIKGEELIPLRTSEISFLCKKDNHVMVCTPQGESYRISMSMNELEEMLDPQLFFRLNRQYIANINHIKKISFFFSSKLIVRLEGCMDERVVVSKEKSAQFKQWLDR